MDELIDSLIDEIRGRNRSPVAVEHRILLNPVHKQISKDGNKDTDGLKWDKEADEHEQVDHIDILVANLKFDALMKHVVFFLVLVEFACWVKA